MNRGRLFFDPLRFRRIKAKENKKKAMRVAVLSVFLTVCLISILMYLFNVGFTPESYTKNILASEAQLLSGDIVGVSNVVLSNRSLITNSSIIAGEIINIGDGIISKNAELAKIEAEKIVEAERKAEAEKKKEEEEQRKLLAKTKKPKPVKVVKASTNKVPEVKDGGDVQPVSMDLNNEYLPVTAGEIDPNGNYGIPEYWPIQGVRVSSPYGYLKSRGRFHAGVDLVADKGTPICSAGAGKVIRAAWFAGYGNCVDIQHSSGYITRYGHLSGYFVKKGDFVNAGVWIGACGSTGRSSCPHLHFEVHKNGKSMNPEHSSLHWTGKP